MRPPSVFVNCLRHFRTIVLCIHLLASSCSLAKIEDHDASPLVSDLHPPPAVYTVVATLNNITTKQETPISESQSELHLYSATQDPTDNKQILGEYYVVQQGDTVASIVRRFDTQKQEFLDANPELNLDTVFLEFGAIVNIPSHGKPKEQRPYLMVPDSEVVYGPAQIDFDLQAAVAEHDGWLARAVGWDGVSYPAPAWQIIEVAALNFSINPRLLLALLEYQSGLLTGTASDPEEEQNPYGIRGWQYDGLENQLIWVAEQLNAGYYGWRSGKLKELRLADGLTWPLNMGLNAGTVAVYNFFAPLYATAEIEHIGSPEGFSSTYTELFGDPFAYEALLIPHDLAQVHLDLPFESGISWNFTGGPHNAWRDSPPWSAIDFAPQLASTGCHETYDWVTSMATGVITRIQDGVVVLNLDSDGYEQTGWTIVYVHIRPDLTKIHVGQSVDAGQRLGHASCDGGLSSTSSHIHLTRKYNGEWIEAGGPLPFKLDGWIVENEHRPYEGKLVRVADGKVLTACSCVSEENQIMVRD